MTVAKDDSDKPLTIVKEEQGDDDIPPPIGRKLFNSTIGTTINENKKSEFDDPATFGQPKSDKSDIENKLDHSFRSRNDSVENALNESDQ